MYVRTYVCMYVCMQVCMYVCTYVCRYVYVYVRCRVQIKVISRWILLWMRNVSDETCRENKNSHFVLNNAFRKLFSLRDNTEKCGRTRHATDDNIIRRMRIACWVPKTTNTHSEYLILIAFPLQQWLHERTSTSRYTCIACLVNSARKVIVLKMTFDIDFIKYAPCLQLLEFQMCGAEFCRTSQTS